MELGISPFSLDHNGVEITAKTMVLNNCTAMKKYVSIFALAAAAVATLVSCSKEIDKQDVIDNGVKMKTITVQTSIAETKTTLDANHENIVWSENDKISIFNDDDNTNTEVAYVAGGNIEVQVPTATTEIYAHYPYYSGNESGPGSVSIYISNDQTQANPGVLNGHNYPMVAKGTVSADNKALISLYPVAAALALNIYHTGLSGEESVKSVTVTPTNTKFIGRQTTDITGDGIQYTLTESSDPIKVTLTNALALSSTKPTDKQTFAGQIYVCLAKQSYSGVKFEIETDKGIYTITSNSTAFDLVNNDFVPVNINLNSVNASFVSFDTAVDPTAYSWTLVKDALSVGDKVVIAAADYAVALSTDQRSNNRGQVGITKSGNAMTANADVQVFEVVAGSKANTVAFKCLNGDQIRKYIAAASSSNNYMHSNGEVNDNASWSVSIDSSSGAASVVAQGSYSRNVLQYNSGSSLFACYGSASQGGVVFYRPSLPPAGISFPQASYSVDLGDPFTAPTLNNPNSVNVTYSSSDTDVATVDASSGAVTIVAAGTTTITASFAGNSTFSATEASYELSVVDPNKVYYVKVTEAPTDWSGQYLILSGNVAFTGEISTTSTKYGLYDAVTVVNNKVESSASVDDYAVTVAKVGDNYSIKTKNNGFLVWTSGNSLNTTANQDSDNSLWSLAYSNGNVSVSNVKTNTRTLRYNSSSGQERFACYESGQNAVQLYKYTDGKTDAGVSVNYSGSITYAPDATVHLNVTNPNSVDLSFTSSSESVATVNNSGVVTIKGAGEATITASWEDKKVGEITYRGGSCEYNLSIAKATPVIAAFADSEVELAVGSSITKTTTIDPTSLSIVYTTSDNTVASIDASIGAVTGLKNGTVTISATFAGNENYNAAESKTYSLKVGTGGSSHGAVTINAAALTNGVLSDQGFTLTCAKNNGSNAPTYNTSAGDIRIYAKGSITIDGGTKTITSIVFNISTQGMKRLAPITASVGTVATQAKGDDTVSWSGSSSSVTFTVGDNATYGSDGSSKAGQLCFDSVTITY